MEYQIGDSVDLKEEHQTYVILQRQSPNVLGVYSTGIEPLHKDFVLRELHPNILRRIKSKPLTDGQIDALRGVSIPLSNPHQPNAPAGEYVVKEIREQDDARLIHCEHKDNSMIKIHFVEGDL